MIRRLFFLLIAVSLANFAWSNPQDDGYSRIARLSYIEGNVSFLHAPEEGWSAASINLPLQPGDRVYTGPDGRAEIEFDDGSVCRLAENTDIELLSLRDDLIQWRMFAGLTTLTFAGDTEFEINTPAAAFNPVRPGTYRFDVIETGATDAIVRKGELEAADNRFSRRIRQGEILHVEPGEYGHVILSRYDRRDQWDDWTDRREAEAGAYAGGRYLPTNVHMGSPELERYGRWVTVESYGRAWMPLYVNASWSPYSVGRWCYRPLWGWTWVSYEPWGWIPYHYGRWYHSVRYGWCWIPGPAFAFNFWSPGLVAFYSGPGWISWCPLGPGDYYNVNNYYFNRRVYTAQLFRLRALHTRAAGDPFNRHVRGAFRTVGIDHFRNGSFGGSGRNNRWIVLDRPWRRGSPVRDRLAVRPTVASYSANPARSVSRPAHETRLPAVVRSNRGRINRTVNREVQRPDRRDASRSDASRSHESRPSNTTPGSRQVPSRWQTNRSSNVNGNSYVSRPSSRSSNSRTGRSHSTRRGSDPPARAASSRSDRRTDDSKAPERKKSDKDSSLGRWGRKK